MRVLLLLTSLLLVAACQAGGDVDLAELTRDAESYEGREVTVRGRVVAFDSEEGASRRHIVVEDEASNRVELLPTSVAEPHVGRTVEVTGTFTFDPSRGRAIEVADIEVVGSDAG